MTTHHHGDDRGPYYRIHKNATGESVAVPEPRDHPATGRDQTDATTTDDDRDQPDETGDQEETMATTRTTKKPTATGRATGWRGAEISIGLTLLTIATGIGTYHLIAGLLRWPRDVALVAAGLAAGLLASSVLGPLWRGLRETLGGWIHPGKTGRS